MAEQANGQVVYANGMPAAGVQVRVFDRDIGGTDDDLTLEIGVSDAAGHFSVRYDQARAADRRQIVLNLGPLQVNRSIADPLDLYLPYFQLRYQSYGQERVDTVNLTESPQTLRLSQPPPSQAHFVPSQHGFRFVNAFPGTPLPFTIPALGGLVKIPSIYGLCGGMSAAAADFLYAGRAIPETRVIPGKRTNLYAYLLRRQFDSFSPMGEPIIRFIKWMKMQEHAPFGTWHRSYIEIELLLAQLDAGVPAQPLGLVFANPGEALWENHQVLACGYTKKSAMQYEIQVYDPNYPENDQVFIRAEQQSISGVDAEGREANVPTMRCERVAIVADGSGRPVEQLRPMRGMFLMPYTPVMPPVGI